MSSARERTLFRLAFAALAVINLVPFWGVRYQPLPDLPNHIAATAVWLHYHDSAWDFERYYRLTLGLTPYWGYYALGRILSAPFGVLLANRIILSLYATAIPVGMLLLARRFGRSPWLSLFAFPFVWNFNLAIGFVPYCLGLATLPFALVAFDHFCDEPRWTWALTAIALGVATFFGHLLAWGMWFAMAGMIGLLHRDRRWKQLGLRLAVWSVPVLVGIWVIAHDRGLTGNVRAGITWVRTPLMRSLQEMPWYIVDNYVTHDDEWPVIVLALFFVVLKVTQKWQTLTLHDLRAEACFLVAIVAYFVLPRSILQPNYWWGINVRFATPAMIFAGLCVTGAIEGWRRWLMAGVAACAVALAMVNLGHWRAADRYFGAREFDALSSLVPPHARVLVLTFPPLKEPEFRQNFVQSYPALYQAQHGGFYPSNFDAGFPLAYKERFPAPGWRNASDFRWDYHARYYDYFLVYRSPGFGVGHAQLVKRDDPWTLWKSTQPRDDVPPAPPYPAQWASDPNWRPRR